jgi:hypothetical protein
MPLEMTAETSPTADSSPVAHWREGSDPHRTVLAVFLINSLTSLLRDQR